MRYLEKVKSVEVSFQGKGWIKVLAAGLIAALLVAVFYRLFVGADDPERIIARAARKQARLSSYYAQLHLVLEPGEAECRYAVQVWFAKPDFYRIELAGCKTGAEPRLRQVLVSDGTKTGIYSPELGDYLEVNPAVRDALCPPFLLSGFFEQLAAAEKKEFVQVEKMNGVKSYRLFTIPASPSKICTREEVWLDRCSLLPVKVESYDHNERLRQVVQFNQVIKNPDLPECVFLDPKGTAATNDN